MARDVDQILKRYGQAVDELKAVGIALEQYESLKKSDVDKLRKRKAALEIELKAMRDEMGAHTAAQRVGARSPDNVHTFNHDPHDQTKR